MNFFPISARNPSPPPRFQNRVPECVDQVQVGSRGPNSNNNRQGYSPQDRYVYWPSGVLCYEGSGWAVRDARMCRLKSRLVAEDPIATIEDKDVLHRTSMYKSTSGFLWSLMGVGKGWSWCDRAWIVYTLRVHYSTRYNLYEVASAWGDKI